MQVSTKETGLSGQTQSLSQNSVVAFLIRYRYLAGLVLIVLFGVILFGRTLDYSLYWDDYHNARPWGLGEVLGTFAGPFDPLGIEPPYFRPLAVVTFAMDWSIWGWNAWGYHLTNLTLHIIGGWLLFTLLRRVKLTWLVALSGTFFFLAIPLNAATVLYISERSDALAAIFTLAGLLFFDNYLRTNKWPWLIAVNVSVVLSLCSKEVGSALVLLLFLYWPVYLWLQAPALEKQTKLVQLWQKWLAEARFIYTDLLARRRWVQLLTVYLPPVLIFIAYLVYRSRVLPIQGLGESYSPGTNPVVGLGKAVYATFKGIPWEVNNWFLPLLVLVTVAALVLNPKSYAWRYFSFGVAFVVVADIPLGPLGGIEPRLVYLPAIGLAIMFAALVMLFIEYVRVVRAQPKPRFVTGLIAFGIAGMLFLGMTLYLEINSQDQFAPYSAKMLYHDKIVYDAPAGYPDHAIQVIEAKLKKAGMIP
ncbi:MAG: hypothetical protein J0I20_33680 [Chloroflexi bacterium]|nr:hypothetical protein [Chloroflexota bacterium]OJV91036.1 MAG: hypothetical protein BGO39_05185 [Chloroflexi bacterium 54-19]